MSNASMPPPPSSPTPTPPLVPKPSKTTLTQLLKHVFGDAYRREHIERLSHLGVTSYVHLSVFDPAKFSEYFPKAPVVACGLGHLASYIRLGGPIDPLPDLSEILQFIDKPDARSIASTTPSLLTGDSSNASKNDAIAPSVSVSKATLAKSASEKLRDYGGALSEWRSWKRHAINFFGIIGAYHVLESDATAAAEPALNESVYFHLTKAISGTQLNHIARNFAASRDGHGMWIAIRQWMETESTKTALASDAKARKIALRLDTHTTAGDYIQEWHDVLQDLEEADEPLADAAASGEFLTQITDPEYKPTVAICRDQKLSFLECTRKIREHELTQARGPHSDIPKSTSRRVARNSSSRGSHQSSSGPSSRAPANFPSIPKQFKDHFPPDCLDMLYKWRAHCLNPNTKDPYGFQVESVPATATRRPTKKARRVSTTDTAPSLTEQPLQASTSADTDDDPSRSSAQIVRRITFNKGRDKNGQQRNHKRNNKKSSPYFSTFRRFRRIIPSTPPVVLAEHPPIVPKLTTTLQDSPRPTDTVLIDDTAAEQHLFGPAFEMLSFTGERVQVQGALHDMLGTRILREGTGCTVVEFPSYPSIAPILLIIPRGLYTDDTQQVESLFHTHQARSHGAVVDNCATIHQNLNGLAGTQAVYIQDCVLPFDFDGTKCFWHIRRPTRTDKATLRRVILSDSTAWLPRSSLSLRRIELSKPDTEAWAARLLYATAEVVRHTLANTTQLYPTIEAETRDLPRRHYKSRTYALRLRHLNEDVYTDTFFASVSSVRGHTCIQGFLGASSGYVSLYPMKRKELAHESLADFLRYQGRPSCLISDNAGEETGPEWRAHCRKALLPQRTTAPHGQNSNRFERCVQDIKRIADLTYQRTAYDQVYWCYLVELIEHVLNHRAVRRLHWKTPMESRWGITPDLSMFRFTFWQPVEYLDVAAQKTPFPATRMSTGRYLGLATSTGDVFTYYILPDPPPHSKRRPRVITRDIVRGIHPQSAIAPHSVPETVTDPQPILYHKSPDELSPETELPEDDIVLADPTVEQQEELIVPTLPPASTNPPRKAFTHHNAKRKLEQAPDLPSNAISQRTIPNYGVVSSISQDSGSYIIIPESATTEVDDINQTTSTDARSQLPIPVTATDPGGPSPPDIPAVTQEELDSGGLDDDSFVNDLPSPEVIHDVHNHFSKLDGQDDDIDADIFDAIVDHRWEKGTLLYRVLWSTGLFTWVPHGVLRNDVPLEVANYIINNHVEGKRTGALSRWARMVKRSIAQTVRRLHRLYDSDSSNPTEETSDSILHSVISTLRRSKKHNPGRNDRQPDTTFGYQVPKTVKQALEIDARAGNQKWATAIAAEIFTLDKMNCFIYKPADFQPSADYQHAPLRMIFAIKPDGRHKARLVVGGHRVDSSAYETYASTVKTLSIRLLDIAAAANGLSCLIGDVGNAFINAITNEKVYCIAGPEFRCIGKEGCVLLIYRSLYGLKTSAERWHTMFADTLRSLEFRQSRFDRDVWLFERPDGYDYICTHVDDFKIFAKDPMNWMRKLQEVYLIKDPAEPSYYLGTDYIKGNDGYWYYGCSTYIRETLNRLESMFGTLPKARSPLPTGDHPEEDESPLLDDTGHRHYQMLIGMAQWLVSTGRFDIQYAVSSLNRFCAAPREGHWRRALRVFGYLKQYPNRMIRIDPVPPDDPEEPLQISIPDFLLEYPDACEEFLPGLPPPKGVELEVRIFFDSDLGHDRITRRSITGIISFVGSTPVNWMSKRQGAVETSTYGAEFSAMRTATEESVTLRFALRSFGIPVTKPTRLYGDNLGVIQNTSMYSSVLKKRHTSLSYHFVREHVAANVIVPIKINTRDNFADCLTKPLASTPFIDLINDIYV